MRSISDGRRVQKVLVHLAKESVDPFLVRNNERDASWQKGYTSFTSGSPCSSALAFSIVSTAIACIASVVKNPI